MESSRAPKKHLAFCCPLWGKFCYPNIFQLRHEPLMSIIWVNPDKGPNGVWTQKNLSPLLEAEVLHALLLLDPKSGYSLSFRNKASALFMWGFLALVTHIHICTPTHRNRARESLEGEGKAIKHSGGGCWLLTKVYIFLFLSPQQECISQPPLQLGAAWARCSLSSSQ